MLLMVLWIIRGASAVCSLVVICLAPDDKMEVVLNCCEPCQLGERHDSTCGPPPGATLYMTTVS